MNIKDKKYIDSLSYPILLGMWLKSQDFNPLFKEEETKTYFASVAFDKGLHYTVEERKKIREDILK